MPGIDRRTINGRGARGRQGRVMQESAVVTAYIALGSNLGDREANVREALRRLDAVDGIAVARNSTLHDTEPVGLAEQNRFINAAAELQTSLNASALLLAMLDIERAMGRVREAGQRWGPRVVDLDLLLYGDDGFEDDGLTIPPRRMHERLFVLDPLNEIAPHVVHPTLGKSIQSLSAALLPRIVK